MDYAFTMLISHKQKFCSYSEAPNMVKTKTLPKQKKSTKTMPKQQKKTPRAYDPLKDLLDEKLIGRAIFECLTRNDPKGVIEVIKAHVMALNQAQRTKQATLAKSTLYHCLKEKNPTIKTLAKLVHT